MNVHHFCFDFFINVARRSRTSMLFLFVRLFHKRREEVPEVNVHNFSDFFINVTRRSRTSIFINCSTLSQSHEEVPNFNFQDWTPTQHVQLEILPPLRLEADPGILSHASVPCKPAMGSPRVASRVIKGHRRSSRCQKELIQVSKRGLKSSFWLKLAREPFIFDDFYII